MLYFYGFGILIQLHIEMKKSLDILNSIAIFVVFNP